MTTEYKLDVFAVLNAAQRKKFDFFDALTDDQRKGFAPVVVQRWLSGTSDPLQLVLTNECVNPYVFSLAKHPDLLYKLMTVAAQPNSGRFVYPKTPKREAKKPLATQVVTKFFGVSLSEASDMIDTLPIDRILDAAYDMGFDSTELKKLKKELV